jgi:LysM repeat protein
MGGASHRPVIVLLMAGVLVAGCGSSSPSITARPTPAPPSITVPITASPTPAPPSITMPTAGTTAHPSPPPQTYVVAKGDTFSKIAQRFGVTVEGLLAANPSIKNPNQISVGDGIVIPTPPAGSIETPTPDVTPEPTPAATPEPTPIPPIADHPGPLRVDGFADVLVTDLAIRSRPAATDSKVLGRLTTGDRVFILKGPVEGSGFAWYRVLSSPESLTSFSWNWQVKRGWVATASLEGEPWLAGRELDCPRQPLDEAVPVQMSALEHLSCFGSQTISLTAQRNSYDDLWGQMMRGTPAWLNDPFLQIEYMTPFANQLVVRYAPGVDAPTGDWARLTGHFDDPASATCRGSYDDPETGERREIPVEAQVLGCRLRFVVTEWVALHRVHVGDTLSEIADAYNVTLAALLAANPQVTDPSLIHRGELLTIPGGGSTP